MKKIVTMCSALMLLLVTHGAWIECATAAVPSVPRQISLQGKVTDAGGAPLLDGMHSATFALYTASSGGSLVWSEGPLNVTTAGGLFSHNLGSVTLLPINLEIRDSLWLQITFDGLVMSPRIHLVSVPSAQIAGALEVRSPNGNFNSVDTDQSGQITTYDGLTSKALTRLQSLDYDEGGNEDGVLMLDAVDLVALESDVELTTRGGEGRLILRSNTIGAELGAGLPGAGGTLHLINGNFGTGVYLAGGQTGDNAVVVPNASISSPECLNEPGVAGKIDSTLRLLVPGGIDNLLSRTLDAPTDGFVLAIVSAQVNFIHSSGSETFAQFAVADGLAFPGGNSLEARIATGGASGTYVVPVTDCRVFPVAAGPHTFHFIADPGAGIMTVTTRRLSLAFFPTGYGTVDPSSTSAEQDGSMGDQNHSLFGAPTETALNDESLRTELESMRSQIARLESILAEKRSVSTIAKPEN